MAVGGFGSEDMEMILFEAINYISCTGCLCCKVNYIFIS